GQIPDEAAGRVGPQARGEAGGGRLTRDALASSGADICDSARRWGTTPTPQQQGPPPTRSSASCGRGWDAEIRGLHVPELIPTCSRRWRRRSCRSRCRCLGARWRTRSTPRLLWWPGSACGGLVEDTPERHPLGFRATESHIKTVAWHLAPMIKGTGGRADASGFTRQSKKAPSTARRIMFSMRSRTAPTVRKSEPFRTPLDQNAASAGG